MFEELVCGAELSHVDDAVLVGAITGWTRAVATAEFHRLAVIAELTVRRGAAEEAAERQYWACDGWDGAAAEVGAACGISARAASGQMHQGVALRHRLPRVAKLMADGMVSGRVVSTISWRTLLVEDLQVMARVDGELARILVSFGSLSGARLENAIDAVLVVHDPAAVRRSQSAAAGCDVSFGAREDTTGTASMWGRLSVVDAELVARRVEQLALMPCPGDPRTVGERRSQALGVLAAGGTQLPCRCEHSNCAAAGADARAEAVVIHVLTDRHPDGGPGPDRPSPDGRPDKGPGPDTGSVDQTPGAPDGPSDDGPDGGSSAHSEPAGPSDGGHDLGSPAQSAFDPAPGAGIPSPPQARDRAAGVAVIAGGAVVPTALLAHLVALGVRVRPVPSGCELGGEPRYRPSARLRRFVCTRDQTCCFPGCDRPAEGCDVDHSTPHGVGGLTHPANTKCLCRKHHLLKTFWTGPTGWTDQQSPDGTIVWISPTGHRYTRPPGSRLLFPGWNTTTPLPAGVTPARPAAGSAERGLTMPTRRRTRAQDRAQRLRAERQRNQRAIDDDPPPF